MKRLSLSLFAVAALALASPAQGQVTITCLEVGPDVVCSTPGSLLDVSGLTPADGAPIQCAGPGPRDDVSGLSSPTDLTSYASQVDPGQGLFCICPTPPGVLTGSPMAPIDVSCLPGPGYSGTTSPGGFGTGGVALATASSGGPLFLVSETGTIFLPPGWVPGTPLGPASMTFGGATFASLGMTQGTFSWTWPIPPPTQAASSPATPPAAAPMGAVMLVIGPPPAVPAASPIGLALLMLGALVLLAAFVGRKTRLKVAH